MGTATTEWERNHGKVASDEARKRAEQRLAEVNEKKEKAAARSAQVAQDFVRETYFEELRAVAYESLKRLYTDMKNTMEARREEEMAKAKKFTISKAAIVRDADVLTGALQVFIDTFGRTRDTKYMWDRAQGAIEAYK